MDQLPKATSNHFCTTSINYYSSSLTSSDKQTKSQGCSAARLCHLTQIWFKAYRRNREVLPNTSEIFEKLFLTREGPSLIFCLSNLIFQNGYHHRTQKAAIKAVKGIMKLLCCRKHFHPGYLHSHMCSGRTPQSWHTFLLWIMTTTQNNFR